MRIAAALENWGTSAAARAGMTAEPTIIVVDDDPGIRESLHGLQRYNKRIAYDISEIAVKVHRGQVMRKMNATSLPDLVRIADKLNFTPGKSQTG